MAPISREAFARSLRGLSDAELAAFVADLWAARGWDTTVGRRAVEATRDGTTRWVVIRPDGWFAGRLPGWAPRPGRRQSSGWGPEFEDADVVVTRSLDGGPPDGTRVVDAAELREMALYAVDPETRARLFDRYVGRPPTSEGRSRRVGLRPPPVPVVASVLLLVTAGVIGALAYGSPAGIGPPAPNGSEPEVTPAPVPNPRPGTETRTPPEAASGVEYPHGVNSDGIWSVDSIVVSHFLLLSSTPHRWEIAYREVVDGRTRGYARETVLVENATVYRSSVERNGTLDPGPFVISDVSTYADGRVRYDRIQENGSTRYQRHVLGPWAGPGQRDLPPFAEDPLRVIEWYLSVRESRLVDTTERDGTRYFHLAGEGDGEPLLTDVRVTATVDERGVVRRLHRVHRLPEPGVQAEITFTASDVGNASVTPPSWLEEARRTTESGSGAVADG